MDRNWLEMRNAKGELRFLRVHVLTAKDFPDCTNDGITSRHSSLYVACPEGPWTAADAERDGVPMLGVELFQTGADKDANAYGMRRGYLRAVQINADGEEINDRWKMDGGNFIYTCDSRFRQLISSYPVAVHDRIEG